MRTKKGATLIEALVFLFVFSIVAVTFYQVWSVGTRFIILAKNRIVAAELANEKMEIVRNLPFENIAHTTGYPAGNLLQEEDVVRSGGTYHVLTQIRNIDDSFDGTVGGTPNDVNFVDYKEVRITVSWGADNYDVSLLSRFVPAGIEQSAAGLGVLVVNVTSDKDSGALVSGSSVRVRKMSGGFDETHQTDSMGRLMLVGIPAAINDYRITITKSNYETIETLAPYPTTAYRPVHEHASVVEGALNTINLFQNRLSQLSIASKDYLNADKPDIGFCIEGGRVIGENVTPQSVACSNTNPDGNRYSLLDDDSTGWNSVDDYGYESPGQYMFSLHNEPGYEIVGMNRENPFTLAPNEEIDLIVKVHPVTETSVLFIVQKMGETMPLAGASVHLTNSTLSYDATVTTDASGRAFFPTDATPFVAGTYDFTVSATGYDDIVGQTTVTAGAIKEEALIMAAT